MSSKLLTDQERSLLTRAYPSRKDEINTMTMPQLIKSTILPGCISWAVRYFTRYLEANPSKEHSKMLKIACSKKVPTLAFGELVVLYTSIHKGNDPEPKQIALGSPLMSAPHLIAGLEGDEPIPIPPRDFKAFKHAAFVKEAIRNACAYCDLRYDITQFCSSCRSKLFTIRRTPGYHEGLFKGDRQALACYARYSKNWEKYVREKAPMHKRVERPEVVPQPDYTPIYDLPDSREKRRLYQYLEEMRIGIRNPKKQGFDFGAIWGNISEVLKNLWENKILMELAMIALITAVVALIVYWLISTPTPTTVSILRILVGGVGILAVAIGILTFLERLTEAIEIACEELEARSTAPPPSQDNSVPGLVDSDDEGEDSPTPSFRPSLSSPQGYTFIEDFDTVFISPPMQVSVIESLLTFLPNSSRIILKADNFTSNLEISLAKTKFSQGKIPYRPMSLGVPKEDRKAIDILRKVLADNTPVKQVELELPSEVSAAFKVLVAGADELTTRSHPGRPAEGPLTTGLKGIRSVAGLFRDVTTIGQTLFPALEWVISTWYQTVYDKAWIPWSQRGVIEKIAPLLERYDRIKNDANRATNIFQNEVYRKSIQALSEDMHALEEILTKTRSPPSYLVPVISARHEIANWERLVLESTHVAKTRAETVHVQIIGNPGTGKTRTVDQLNQDLAPILHAIDPSVPAVFNAGMMFTKKPEVKFWDGYKGQHIVFFDDFLQQTDAAIRATQAMDVISCVNGAPFQLNMSSVNDKQGTYFRARLLFTTRNGGVALSNLGLTDAKAFARRIHLLLEMLPESGDSHESWYYNIFNVSGNLEAARVPYADIVQRVAALVLAHDAESKVPSKPTGVNLTDLEGLLEKGKVLAAQHRVNARGLKNIQPQAARKPGYTVAKKQGLTSSRLQNDYEFVRKEATDLVEEYSEAFDEFRPQIADKINALRKSVGLDSASIDGVFAAASSASEAAETALGDAVDKLIEAKDHNLSTWQRVQAWFEEAAHSVSTAITTSYTNFVVWSTKKTFMNWISQNKLASITFAFGAASLLGAILVGAYFGIKGMLAPAPLPDLPAVHQSRTEKEEARDFARARTADRNLRIAKGKRLPNRMQGKGNKGNVALTEDDFVAQIEEAEVPLMQLFSRNLYRIQIEKPETTAFGQIWFIAGQVAITATHVIEHIKLATGPLTLVQGYATDKDFKYNRLQFKKEQLVMRSFKGSELAYILFPNSVPAHPSLLKHIAKDADHERWAQFGMSKVRMLYRTTEGGLLHAEAPHAQMTDHPVWDEDADVCYYGYHAYTMPGTSGGLFFTANGKPLISGVHVGASQINAYAELVSYELIQENLADVWATHMVPTTFVPQCALRSNTATPVKSQTIPLGLLEHPHNSSGRNGITPSPIAPYLARDEVYPIVAKTGPTLMYPQFTGPVIEKWKKLGVLPEDAEFEPMDVDPLANSFANAPKFHHIDDELLERAYDPDDIPGFPNGYRILTPEEAVHGNEAMGIPPIDYTTSIGYNHTGDPNMTREKMLGLKRGERRATQWDEWSSFLREPILDLFRIAHSGEYPAVPVVDSLKAERRKWKRVFKGDTRLFANGWFPALIFNRMIAGCLFTATKATPTTSVPAIGINPTSWAWREIATRTLRFPNKIVTDAANYDKHNQIGITKFLGKRIGKQIAAENEIIDHNKGKTHPEIYVLKAEFPFFFLASALTTANAIHVSGSLAYWDSQTMTSGSYATSEWNSFRNQLETRSVFLVLLDENRDSVYDLHRLDTDLQIYKKHVDACYYGDDRAISASNLVAPWFNTYSLAVKSAEIFGEELTLPSKEPITPSVGFATFEEADFLKRKFVYSNGFLLAPLDKSIIEESMLWVHNKGQAHATTTATVRSALFEAAMHGREYYSVLYDAVRRACKHAQVEFDPISYEKVIDLVHKSV